MQPKQKQKQEYSLRSDEDAMQPVSSGREEKLLASTNMDLVHTYRVLYELSGYLYGSDHTGE